jgi:hypothetical protein
MKYQIWICDEKGNYSIYKECKTLTETGIYLGLNVNQVKERLSWNRGIFNPNSWHVQNSYFRYQIVRL